MYRDPQRQKTVDTFKNLDEKLSKLNLMTMTKFEIARWLRENSDLSIIQATVVAGLVKEAHRIGELRGRALK